MAARLASEAGPEPGSQVELAYRLAFEPRSRAGRARARDRGSKAVRAVVAGAGDLQLQRISLSSIERPGREVLWTGARSSPGHAMAWPPQPPRRSCSATAPLHAGVPGESHPPCPHFTPKARRAIHICLCGAMSHVDTFDYKPALIAAHGQSLKTATRPDVFFGQVGLLQEARLEISPARAERPLGLRSFPASGRGRRRADSHPFDGRRDLEPHAGDVPGEQRIPAERLPRDGGLAELRPGQRVRRLAGVRRDSRRTRVSGRRHDQLDQRLPPRAASRRGHPTARGPDRRPLPARPDRRSASEAATPRPAGRR